MNPEIITGACNDLYNNPLKTLSEDMTNIIHEASGKTKDITECKKDADDKISEYDIKNKTEIHKNNSIRTVEAEEFYEKISIALKNKEHGFISELSKEEYQKIVDEYGKLIMYGDLGGIAVTGGGEIISFFKSNKQNNSIKIGPRLIHEAIENGGKTIECFGAALARYYQSFGFKIIGKSEFNSNEIGDNWNYEKNGTPDYYLLELRKNSDNSQHCTIEELLDMKNTTNLKIKAMGKRIDEIWDPKGLYGEFHSDD